ncbi:hypothetical protein [Hoeflea sp. AS16]|uniref:hypothetical protein n=1 Tax=Hoeflea sp. AS16 TaxID=3135779 RepID=UPI00316FC3D1
MHKATLDKRNQMARLRIARYQLGTALKLFIDDDDPISVQILTSAAREIAGYAASSAGKIPWSYYQKIANPNLDDLQMKKLMNEFANSFKHPLDYKKQERNSWETFVSFNDDTNAHHLFFAWFDYLVAAESAPPEAQVFQIWYPLRMGNKNLLPNPFQEFENIDKLPLSEAKWILRRVCQKARQNIELMNDPKTDKIPLIMTRKHFDVETFSLSGS